MRCCIDLICTLFRSSSFVADGAVCLCRRCSGSKHAAVKSPAAASSIHSASGAICHACVGEEFGDLLTSDGAVAAVCALLHSKLPPVVAHMFVCCHFQGVHDGSDECVVCQESLVEKELGTIIMLPCHHIFHRACLSEWLGRAGSCPTCVIRWTLSASSSFSRLFSTSSCHTPSILANACLHSERVLTFCLNARRCRRPLLLPPAQPAREAGHIIGMPEAEAEMNGGVVVIEVGAPVAAAAPNPGGSDVEMQLMRPAAGLASADQEAIASATCLSDLKCWQDLPPEEAGMHDNRWLLSVQQSDGQPLPDGQTYV